MRRMKKEYQYLTFLTLIIFCVFQYGIRKIFGFTIYPDEFGYWASAAKSVGYDWSEVASMGSYYSFGYSAFLIPILAIFSNGVTAYRAAVFLNMLLMCVCVFLFQKIMERIFPEVEKGRSILASGIAVLYPSWIFYMQMTMAEGILFFLFVLACYLFVLFFDTQRVTAAVFLGVTLIYFYCVHMRTVGVLIACIICLMLWAIAGKGKKKRIFLFGIAVALSGILAFYMKNRTVVEVFAYAEQSELAGNDYQSQWGKIADIFTFSGFVRFLQEIIGKIFYLGLASFGLFYPAFGWCVKNSIILFRDIKNKKLIQTRDWFALFLLLAVTGEVLISSIYMHGSTTLDCLIYGRYNDFLVPVMMLIGVVIMCRKRLWWVFTLTCGTLSGGMALLLLEMAERYQMSKLRGYHIAGISYLIDEKNSNIALYFRDTWLLGFGLMILVSLLIWLSNRWKSSWWMLTGILTIEIVAGIQISNHYIFPANNTNYESLQIADCLREHGKEKDVIYFLDEEKPEFVDFIQMQLPKKVIHVTTREEYEENDVLADFLLTSAETQYDKELSAQYSERLETNTFCLYYNQ